eukprot:gene18298-37157_t
MALSLVKLVHLLAWVMLVASSIQKNRLISAQTLDEQAVMRLRRWDKVSGAMAGLMLLSDGIFYSRQPLNCADQNLDAP